MRKTLKDLEAQVRVEKSAIATLRQQAARPIQLPSGLASQDDVAAVGSKERLEVARVALLARKLEARRIVSAARLRACGGGERAIWVIESVARRP